jgi:hypothetical protein
VQIQHKKSSGCKTAEAREKQKAKAKMCVSVWHHSAQGNAYEYTA